MLRETRKMPSNGHIWEKLLSDRCRFDMPWSPSVFPRQHPSLQERGGGDEMAGTGWEWSFEDGTDPKATREQAKADVERVTASLSPEGRKAVAPDMLAKFASDARKRMRNEKGGYRRDHPRALVQRVGRSEAHTSELPSLMRNSYADFCLNT